MFEKILKAVQNSVNYEETSTTTALGFIPVGTGSESISGQHGTGKSIDSKLAGALKKEKNGRIISFKK